MRACELIVKMESLAHSAELGLELDDSGKRSYSLLRDMLPPLETLHCATAFSMQSCAESAYQPYADGYH